MFHLTEISNMKVNLVSPNAPFQPDYKSNKNKLKLKSSAEKSTTFSHSNKMGSTYHPTDETMLFNFMLKDLVVEKKR